MFEHHHQCRRGHGLPTQLATVSIQSHSLLRTRREAVMQKDHHAARESRPSTALARTKARTTCDPHTQRLTLRHGNPHDPRQDDQSHAYTQFTPHRNNHETNNHNELNPCHTRPPTSPLLSSHPIPSRRPSCAARLYSDYLLRVRTCVLRMSQVRSSLCRLFSLLSSTDPIGPPRRVHRNRLGIFHSDILCRRTLLHLTTLSPRFT